MEKFIIDMTGYNVKRVRLSNPNETDITRIVWTRDGELVGNGGEMVERLLSMYYGVPLNSSASYRDCGDIMVDGLQCSIKTYGATVCNDIFFSADTLMNRWQAIKQYMAHDASDCILYGIITTNGDMLSALTVYRLDKPFWQELLTYYAVSTYFADIDGYKLRARFTQSKLERYIRQYEKTGTLFCGVAKRTH